MKFENLSKLILHILILNALLLTKVLTDQPVHCKKTDIEGIWTFRISTDKFDANLNNQKTSCGHGLPNHIDTTIGDSDYTIQDFINIEITLGTDYKVYESNLAVGNWTPIYDEGFIVNYKSSIYTAFMKYYKKNNSNVSDDSAYISNCEKTMIGWYIADNKEVDKNWSCFYGVKSKLLQSGFLQNMLVSQQCNTVSMASFMELSAKVKDFAKVSLMSMKYDEQIDLVNQVNNLNLGWVADIHEEFKGLSFFELKEKLGLLRDNKRINSEDSYSDIDFNKSNQPNYIQKNSVVEDLDNILNSFDTMVSQDPINQSNNNQQFNQGGSAINNPQEPNTQNNENLTQFPNSNIEVELDSQFVTDYAIKSKYIDKELDEMDINILPKNWDWRNVGGINYVPRPRLQLNCGSCYIFSMVSSLESRLRILTDNKDQTEFSRQFPLSYSFYTEGCKGGYPIFVAKFFNEFEILPESCFGYNPGNVSCSNMCDYTKLPIKYFVSRYGYLGGFYGATSEVDIIKELRARGPIPGNMSVPLGFSYYKSGIFSQNKLIQNSGHFSRTTLFDKNLGFSSVDHSILLVGYGEENGVKYWIGMNTWGEKWGENGYFRILRGENDCNIETMGDYARISFKPRFS